MQLDLVEGIFTLLFLTTSYLSVKTYLQNITGKFPPSTFLILVICLSFKLLNKKGESAYEKP